MAGNSIGITYKLSTFGASHGEAIGGVVDGCPAGLVLDIDLLQQELDRRRPGQSAIVTQRKEGDKVRILSGLLEGKTLGTPIGFVIENSNQRSKDYEHISKQYRPSHADYTYDAKFGIRDHRGGGRSSARETACRVVGGAIAKQLLAHYGVSIQAYVSQVGHLKLAKDYSTLDFSHTEQNPVRCPDPEMAVLMEERIREIRKEGDTIGGVVSAVLTGVPAGLGEPVFDRLHADLAKAMMSINAVKGFEYGSGFDSVSMKGSEHNDAFVKTDKGMATKTNRSGGIQGGISNGEDIYFRVAFKPVATIMQDQESLDKDGAAVIVKGKGRHDPCVVPRAVPIVEAMAAIILADHWLRNRASVI